MYGQLRRGLALGGSVALTVSAVVASGVSAKPSGDGPGNSQNAKACQKGGWQDLVREDGTSFADQGECVSYAARGGALQRRAQRAYQSSFGDLYVREIPTGEATLVGSFGVSAQMTDLATAPDGTLYGISFNELYRIDTSTGLATLVAVVGPSSFNALAFSPGGVLYAARSGTLFTIDPSTGTVTPIGAFGEDLASDGDIAFDGAGTLYATVRRRASLTSLLATVDPATGAATIIGPVGRDHNFGLVALDGTLYAAAQDGALLSLDKTTGTGTVLDAEGPQATGLAPVP